MYIEIKLSKLEASRRNPRRVKPERDAHRRLVASIRAHGLLEPLLVRPSTERGYHRVIAGNRRLAALREAFRGEDPGIPCVLRDVEESQSEELSLAENFAREPMHPLDEAESFARLASIECKGVSAISADFGVSERYIRQRMRLAGLAEPIKVALRKDKIGILTAEAFSAVPVDRQEAIWKELGGKPTNAQQVRNLIENEWIPAEHALFDVSALDPMHLTHDLFGGSVLIARAAFLTAQAEALQAEQAQLLEEGWAGAVIGVRDDIQPQLYKMDEAEPEYDRKTVKKLERLSAKRSELERVETQSEDEEDALAAKLDALDEEERQILAEGTSTYSESVKAAGTVFLTLAPDGRIDRHYRVPRQNQSQRNRPLGDRAPGESEKCLPTADELTDSQRAHLHTHELLAVREGLAADPLARKRLLVMTLHDRIGRDSLILRRHATGAALFAETAEGFGSSLTKIQRHRRLEVDPITEEADEVQAYRILQTKTEEELDALIGVLTVEFLTASLTAPTPLVRMLGEELRVELRKHWTPDAAWLAGYRKAQLADLIGKLQGPAHGSAALQRKKSELVAEVATLFKKAAEGPDSMGDAELAERACRWLPVEAAAAEEPTPA